MTTRRIILGCILLTLLVTVLAASAKLRATPKYDRIQVGMDMEEVEGLLGPEKQLTLPSGFLDMTLSDSRGRRRWEIDERTVLIVDTIIFWPTDDKLVERRVVSKELVRRGPLERLAWLAGWRE